MHVETALIFITPAALCATGERHLRRFLCQKKIDVVEIAHIMMIGHGRALIQRLMIERISRMNVMCAIGGGKRRMINQIENMKREIDELEYTVKKKSDENETLREENKSLKQRIKDLEDACNGSCFSDEKDERDKLIAELQDQYQQDCIKINQLHVTIDTLVGKYARIRKTVGMD